LSARLEANVKNAELLGLEAVKIFEIGKVFGKVSSKDSTAVGSAPYKETLTLALAAAQVKKVKGRDGKLIISETLKEISEAIGFELPVKSLLSSGSNAVAEIELDQQAEKADEITASPALFASSAVKVSYKPFSLYPFIVRDIAVFVPEVSVGTAAPSTPIAAPDVWAEIAAAVESARVGAGAVPGGETILVRHSLFDTFKKDGKVSYAFRLVFQSMSRTLTDVEAKAVMDKVYARMVERGWQVR
jgi:phenylalanyl-tRNA synthetase beta subunit